MTARAPALSMKSALLAALAWVFWGALGGVSYSSRAHADTPSASASATSPSPERHHVDGVAVRFYSPETGGPEHPLFITERTLAFEARLEALQEGYAGGNEKQLYAERHVRAALEHHVAEEMLSRLAYENPPPLPELARQIHDVGIALVTRIGGEGVLLSAASAEGIALVEVDAMLRRQAKAGIYIDRAINPILHPSEDQLREVFRTAAHPYRGMSFEDARPNLERWFVAERLRVAKSAFLQTARTRVKIVAVSR